MRLSLERQFALLNELYRLTTVQRANELLDGSRAENSAEHSWHLGLWALAFEPIAPDDVQIDRVIRMLLLHDLVEIDAGDHPIHLETDWKAVAKAETAAAHRIFGLLPDDQGRDLSALWHEFEAAETPDAVFAKRLDIAQPLIQVAAAAAPPQAHLDIAHDNLAKGRAATLHRDWPALTNHVTALLDGTEPKPCVVTRTLDFLNEADQLKSVLRATKTVEGSRRENSGEHSWHIALYGWILKEHAARPVDLDRVIRMLLIHDLVEIDVGDVPIHSQGGAAHASNETQAAETRAADRIFGLLPDQHGLDLRLLWDEFEATESNDAVFAKSVDRVQPVICNLENQGGTWPEFNVTAEQLETRVGAKVARGAPDVWGFLKDRIGAWFRSNNVTSR